MRTRRALALFLAALGATVSSSMGGESQPMPEALVGTWFGDDVKVVLEPGRTGVLYYDPPSSASNPCVGSLGPVWKITQWVFSKNTLTIKIAQNPEAFYDDGRAYRLHIKATFSDSWLTLTLSDANHVKRVVLTRDAPADLIERLLTASP